MPVFRIRRVFDDVLPIDREEIAHVQEILRSQFTGVREKEIASLPAKLRNPLKYKFRHILLVADDLQRRVRGFALLSHEPDLRFCYLDYLASAKTLTGGGIGGALYQRVRDEARLLEARGLLFECLPDVAEECDSPEIYKANVARLRFYERFGARPIIHNEYQLAIKPGDRGLPFLVLDPLDTDRPLRRSEIQPTVRAILERKYGHLCPREYVDRVAASFRDDPVQLRPPRYIKSSPPAARPPGRPEDARIALVLNDNHQIHHVHDRGYVQAPVRIKAIMQELEPTGLFDRLEPRSFPESMLRTVHDGRFVDYLKRACENVQADESIYPYVFPIRNIARPPRELAVRAGYYCIDTFTPLNRNAFLAAKAAVDCALTATECILKGRRLAYALVRPPGHHAERRTFGGFCYFNSNAIAAHHLSRFGRVAILDIDYHHGNGQQDIFYERDDVLTLSIHGHPRFAYPYFSGFEEEKGIGAGEGYNVNFPLAENLDGARYRQTLERALSRVRRFAPSFLVVAFGLDTAKGDPTGSWSLGAQDFELNGKLIGALGLPTLVVQEGGYRTRTLGINARHFFVGLAGAVFGQRTAGPRTAAPPLNDAPAAKPAANGLNAKPPANGLKTPPPADGRTPNHKPTPAMEKPLGPASA